MLGRLAAKNSTVRCFCKNSGPLQQITGSVSKIMKLFKLLLLHESEVQPRTSINNKDILQVWWGLTGLVVATRNA